MRKYSPTHPLVERRRHLMGEINVTPFVDVMLVLLVIFMITAPLMQHGMDVQLPQATTSSVEIQDIPTVTLKSNKRIYWNDKEMKNIFNLTGKLDRYAKGNPKKIIYFRADRALDYGFVVKVLAVIRGAGIDNISMVTEPLEL